MATGKFESQMQRLEEIVKMLEGDEIGLDEAIKVYEEGLKIAKNLNKQLTAFENKIETIDATKEENDEF